MVNKILLADDSITIQKVVNLTFADEGIEVVAVSNGDMAERRLSEVNPDLVLADIFMPGKNGYELCESIKKSPQFHNVPVVLLVGAFEPFDQAEARRVRADAHLTKPFESRTLVDTVRKLIRSNDQRRTGSLSQSQPADAQDERKADAQGSASQGSAAPSTRPDLPAMPDQAAPVASERTTAAQSQEGADYAEGSSLFEVQLAPEPYQEQPDFSSASDWTERPGPTPRASADRERLSDPFDLTPLEVSAQDMGGAPSPAGVEVRPTRDLLQGFENVDLDLEDLDSPAPSDFGYGDKEMILDLERPEPVFAREADSAASFDLASDRTFTFNTGGLRSETAQVASRGESDVFKTQMLETPAGLTEAEERINTNPLEMPPATDFSRPSSAPGGFAELEEETLSSTLLAVDDPLGDVLMDEAEMEALSYDPQAAPQVLFAEQPANVEFNLEFIPQDEKVFDVAKPDEEVFDFEESLATASRATGELVEPAHSSFEAAHAAPADIDAIEQAAESYAPRETAAVEAEPVASGEPAGASTGVSSFTAATESAVSDVTAGRAESGFEFSTDFQLAAPEKDSDQAGYAFDSLNERLGEEAEPARGAEFTTSEMWGEQEARFAPIDIEATPVDESDLATRTSGRDGLETGFELASGLGEELSQFAGAPVAESPAAAERMPYAEPRAAETAAESQAVEVPAESRAVEVAAEPRAAEAVAESPAAEAATETAELSPALLDEIVRRVVARMTEVVVRDVAWEVVPDVVERVIKEMAREEVSKRI